MSDFSFTTSQTQPLLGPQIGPNVRLPTIQNQRKIFMLPDDYGSRDESSGNYIPMRNKDKVDAETLKTDDITTEVNFIDVVNIDSDDALEGYITEDLLGRLIESPIFKAFIITTLLLNAFTIALQTTQVRVLANTLQAFDLIFLTVFVVEILLKWYHGFILYWRSGWNIFDFCVVAVSIFSPILPLSPTTFFYLNLAKPIRLLRFWTVMSGVRMIVQVVITSTPDLANILILITIMILIFAIIGVTLFQSIMPQYFPTVQDAMFTMFIYLTQDGWAGVLEAFIEVEYFWVPSIFSIIFVILGPFVLGNAFIGVIVYALEKLIAQLSKSKKARHRTLESEKLLKQETINVKQAVRTDGVQNNVYKRQAPLAYTDFSKLNVQNFENYCLILTAIEDNLAEFKKLKSNLEEILLDVKRLNTREKGEEEEEKVNLDSEANPTIPGDVLSQMIRAGDYKDKPSTTM